MAPKCDLDACSLKDDISEIKKNQVKMTETQAKRDVSQGRFEQKMEDYMEHGKDEHDILFARTKHIPQGNVKWTHLATVVFVLGTIIGIVWKIATAGGH